MRTALGLAAALVLLAAPVLAQQPPTRAIEPGDYVVSAGVWDGTAWRVVDAFFIQAEHQPAVCAPRQAPDGAG